jgi:glycosyltransferase involved in cell wall biosynthesis
MLAALAAKLGISEFVDLLPPVDRAELGVYLRRSFAVLAPLAVNDRNVTQGCCPLKILEGMAAGVPVISSDLPVVRELGEHGAQFLLVKPGSTDQIAEAVLRLNADRPLWRELSRNGRAHVAANYTWEQSGEALVSVAREALRPPVKPPATRRGGVRFSGSHWGRRRVLRAESRSSTV